ncbi:MAG TPA: DUF6599 family protein, partial [Acidobacteriota bacterium]|nr:DUF6599 family protein [Acidobacteriota bacterium]
PYADFREIGVEGYVGDMALNFWAGPYYVKIAVFEGSEEMEQEMIKLAGWINDAIVEKIGGPGSVPPELAFFPVADRVAHSFRYLPHDVLGQVYLKEGFEAKYRKGDSEIRLVIASAENSETAAENLARYRQFTASGGKVFGDVAAAGDGGFTGSDPHYGYMAAVRSGNRLIIALGAPSVDEALSLVKACLSSQ